eukprot:m.169211 g.169211  ORF g.169211 m.169211 type:complete len:52 (+) comp53219_c0_seq9:1475-1630(+)
MISPCPKSHSRFLGSVAQQLPSSEVQGILTRTSICLFVCEGLVYVVSVDTA